LLLNTQSAPAAVGPYSQAIKAGDYLFFSGQIPLDPQSGKIVGNDIKIQNEQVLKNLYAILKSEGWTFQM
jgi:2-iminobutanoate/2-iminopropanoate deaminase